MSISGIGSYVGDLYSASQRQIAGGLHSLAQRIQSVVTSRLTTLELMLAVGAVGVVWALFVVAVPIVGVPVSAAADAAAIYAFCKYRRSSRVDREDFIITTRDQMVGVCAEYVPRDQGDQAENFVRQVQCLMGSDHVCARDAHEVARVLSGIPMDQRERFTERSLRFMYSVDQRGESFRRILRCTGRARPPAPEGEGEQYPLLSIERRDITISMAKSPWQNPDFVDSASRLIRSRMNGNERARILEEFGLYPSNLWVSIARSISPNINDTMTGEEVLWMISYAARADAASESDPDDDPP